MSANRLLGATKDTAMAKTNINRNEKMIKYNTRQLNRLCSRSARALRNTSLSLAKLTAKMHPMRMVGEVKLNTKFQSSRLFIFRCVTIRTNTAPSVYDCDHNDYQHSMNPLCTKHITLAPSESECVHTSRKNLIIWDWDDTIFPTYAFRTHQDRKDKHFKAKLSILVCLIERVFTEMIDIYGASNIIIVTNGSPSWVHKCLNVDIVRPIFLKFQTLLQTHKIQSISASTPEMTRRYPTNPYKWKETVFSRLFRRVFDGKYTGGVPHVPCITSIGDSLYEYKASFNASRHMKHRILNRVKFKSNPSLNDMIFQFQDILSRIHTFAVNVTDIELNYCSVMAANESVSYSDTSCS
eukprot:337120_1